MSDQPTVWLTVKETADRAHVTGGTVRRAIREGKLAAFRLSETSRGRLRIRLSDIDRWLTAQPIVAKAGA